MGEGLESGRKEEVEATKCRNGARAPEVKSEWEEGVEQKTNLGGLRDLSFDCSPCAE